MNINGPAKKLFPEQQTVHGHRIARINDHSLSSEFKAMHGHGDYSWKFCNNVAGNSQDAAENRNLKSNDRLMQFKSHR
jgi:DUF971 family protein